MANELIFLLKVGNVKNIEATHPHTIHMHNNLVLNVTLAWSKLNSKSIAIDNYHEVKKMI
jgi:hypothetical protein